MFQITLCLSNLMLTGSATPYLHNGIMSADDDDATNFEVKQIQQIDYMLECSSLEMGKSESHQEMK